MAVIFEDGVYIDYLNKELNFKKDRISFPDYKTARLWAIDNLEKFDPDMVNYH